MEREMSREEVQAELERRGINIKPAWKKIKKALKQERRRCKDCQWRRKPHSQFKNICLWWLHGRFADNCSFYSPKWYIRLWNWVTEKAKSLSLWYYES